MALLDTLINRVRILSPNVRIAVIAECADRVRPIYEEGWEGTYSTAIGRSVEIGWAYALGNPPGGNETRSSLVEVQELVTFYREDGLDLLGDATTVILRLLQALTNKEEECCKAIARGLITTRDTAQSAEAEGNLGPPGAAATEQAVAEEKAWQEAALDVAAGWTGVADRKMFEQLGEKPPKWLKDWRVRKPR